MSASEPAVTSAAAAKPEPFGILLHGHPLLSKIAADVTFPLDAEAERAIQEMLRALGVGGGGDGPGRLGVAAPQVGWSLAMFVMAVEKGKALLLINPKVTVPLREDGKPQGAADLIVDREGCLSVPGVSAFVERFPRVRVTYQDRTGQTLDLDADGMAARVIQHEHDHLLGLTIVDRQRSKLARDRVLRQMKQAVRRARREEAVGEVDDG